MIAIYHNKDNDGHTSGAIVKYKYPDCKLVGFDYSEEIPDFKQFVGEDVIMIDVTFPIATILMLADISRLTIIDHHISFKKQVDELTENQKESFTYIYEDGIAACEIGWKYLFPDRKLPRAVELVSKYDTWRDYGTKEWNNYILPFKYGILTILKSPETFPVELLDENPPSLFSYLENGKAIMQYEQLMNEVASKRSGFEREVYGGLRGLCLNQRFFSSETMMSIYDESKYDILIGFEYTGRKWAVSLRSTKDEVNVSLIAKARGGGGHAKAAGFEVDSFDKIFL